MRRQNVWLGGLALLGALLSGCGSDSDNELDSCSTTASEDMENTAGDCKEYPKLDQAYRSRVDQIFEDAQGNVCYIAREYEKEDGTYSLVLSDWQYQMECLDNQKNQLHSYVSKSKDIIKDIVQVGDNELVLAELVALPKADGQSFNSYALKLHHKTFTGSQIKIATLLDEPEDKEVVYYNTDFENDVITKEPLKFATYGDDIPVLVSSSEVELIWKNNKLHVLAATYGLKYYRFNASLELEYETNLIPAHSMLWSLSQEIIRTSAMTVLDNGKVLVSADMNSEQVRYFNDFFDTSLVVGKKNTDQLITLINVDESIERFLVGKADERELIAGAKSVGNEVWLLSNIRTEKDNAAGGTTEWDVALKKLDLAGKQLEQYFVLHENKEDIAWDFEVVDDEFFIISGANGYTQVDTNSQVSNAQGFHWLVNHQGQIVDKELVEGERNTYVTRVSVSPNKRILHAKVHDGFITHTCDNDPDDTLCYDKTMIEASSITP